LNTTTPRPSRAGVKHSLFEQIRRDALEIWKYRYVTISYVYTTTKIRYKRSYLGYIWTVFGPMLHYIMIGFIMGLLLKDRMQDYYANYFSGALFFSVVSGVIGKSPSIMISNEHFIRKIYVPKTMFLLNVVSYELWNFALSATGLLVIGFATGAITLHATFPLSLAALLLTGLFLAGIASMISVATVYFRDLGHIIPVLLQALFFATPIAYSKEMLPAQYHWIATLNPITYFLDLFRLPLISGKFPPTETWLVAGALSLLSLTFGLWLLKKYDNKIVFKL